MLALRCLALLALLAACAPQARSPLGTEPQALPAGALRSSEADANACLAQGHPIGTDDYARCLLRLAEQRRAGAAPGTPFELEEAVKLGDWCYVATAPEPFPCFDI